MAQQILTVPECLRISTDALLLARASCEERWRCCRWLLLTRTRCLGMDQQSIITENLFLNQTVSINRPDGANSWSDFYSYWMKRSRHYGLCPNWSTLWRGEIWKSKSRSRYFYAVSEKPSTALCTKYNSAQSWRKEIICVVLNSI